MSLLLDSVALFTRQMVLYSLKVHLLCVNLELRWLVLSYYYFVYVLSMINAL